METEQMLARCYHSRVDAAPAPRSPCQAPWSKAMKKWTLRILIAVLFPAMLACGKENEGDIRVGGLFDLTGQTAETGIMYALGIRHCIDMTNRAGGINGRRVRLHEIDTAYLPSLDVQGYEKLRREHRVHLILGWGTGGTLALASTFNRDQMPYTSVSFSKSLAAGPKAQYHFMMGPTYSDQMLVILRHIHKVWTDTSRRPRVAFIYNDTEFGKSPVPEGRRYCEALGIELVAEEVVILEAMGAIDQLKRIAEKKADYVIINETAQPASVILRDAKKIGLRAQFFGLVWCSDDKVILLAGDAAEGFMGVMTYNFSDKTLPGLMEISSYRQSTGQKDGGISLRYVNGWLTAKIMLEGVRRAGSDLSGPAIRKGLESIRDFDTGGITPKISFSPENHVAFREMRIGRVVRGAWHAIPDSHGRQD